jgi:hypothetical protein
VCISWNCSYIARAGRIILYLVAVASCLGAMTLADVLNLSFRFDLTQR